MVVPPEGIGSQRWAELLSSDLTDRRAAVGFSLALFEHDANAREVDEPTYGQLFGVDLSTVDEAAWASADQSYLVLSGAFSADDVESELRHRFGDALTSQTLEGVTVLTWPSGPSRTQPFGPLFAPLGLLTAVAVEDGNLLAAGSATGIEAMIGSRREGTGLSASRAVPEVLDLLEREDVVSASSFVVDGEAIYEAAAGDQTDWEPLLPYARVGIGWRMSPAEASDPLHTAVVVFDSGDAGGAEGNAERFSALVGGRSSATQAPWEESGVGPVLESRVDERFAVVTIRALPDMLDKALVRGDNLFASHAP